MTACRCEFCSRKLEPAQELRFLVETETLDNPVHLERIRMLPARSNGRPMRVCKSCQISIEAHPRRLRTFEREESLRQFGQGMLAAVGFLSLGWLLTTLVSVPRA